MRWFYNKLINIMHCVCGADIELLEHSSEHKTKFNNRFDLLRQKMDNNRRQLLAGPAISTRF